MLSELRAEDAGEVRFQAGPAQSVAQLEVEGKQLGPRLASRMAAGPKNALPSLPRGTVPGWFTEGSAFPWVGGR